jgi:hypothetical protein
MWNQKRHPSLKRPKRPAGILHRQSKYNPTVGYQNEVAHSAEYDSKSSLANVQNVLNAIFTENNNTKNRADCCRLLQFIALIYFKLHHQRTMTQS